MDDFSDTLVERPYGSITPRFTTPQSGFRIEMHGSMG